MKSWRFAMPALMLGCVSFAALGAPPRAAAQQVQALNPPPTNEMQSEGKVGDTTYRWTNGRAWLSLNDDAKVAMVAGLEQGIILAVRENWNAMPKQARATMEQTAGRLTVGGVTFDQLVLQIDNFYILPGNINVPVVDAYLYALLALKKAPEEELKNVLNNLRKTYPAPVVPKAPKETH